MRFYCIDGAGHSYVEARFESDFDSLGNAESALFRLPVEAVSIDLFIDELQRLGEERSGTAFLKGKI